MMRILLHIGSPKTGTTSLQQTLSAHRAALQQIGICYPDLAPQGNHSFLSLPFYSETIPRQYLQTMGSDKVQVDATALAYWAEVKRQWGQQQEAHTLLLSGEHFLGIDDHAGLARHLAALFPGAALQILCYLRDPVSYYTSMLQQHAKSSGELYWPRAEGWAEQVKGWRSIGALTLREFAPAQLRAGNIVADTLSWVSDQAAGLALKPRRSNVSLSAEASYLQYNYRRQIHRGRDNLLLPDSQQLEAILRRAEACLSDEGRRPQLQPGLRARAILAAAEDLTALRADLGFTFSDASLYGLAAAQSALAPQQPPQQGAAPLLEDIFNLDHAYLQRLQFETFAHLLQGTKTRGK